MACCGCAGAQGWYPLQNGASVLKADNPIFTMCVDDSNNVYAAGKFTDSIDGYGYRYVAKWSCMAHSWTQLGTGTSRLKANNNINSICVDRQGNVYAAGLFTDDTIFTSGNRYVAKWEAGTGQWRELGTGVNSLNANSSINSICVDDSGNVYAAGNFRDVYGQSYVAKWNGANWSELGGLNTGSFFINSICVDNSHNVYAGGSFMDSSGFPYVAEWSNSTGTWSKLGIGFDTAMADIEIECVNVNSVHNVYASVSFENSLGWSGDIFKWDSVNWNLVGGAANRLNANGTIFTTCVTDSGYVYAAGQFFDTAGFSYVAKFSPQSNRWDELGSGADALKPHNYAYSGITPIISLCLDNNGNVYAGGAFSDSITSTNNYCFIAEYGPSSLGMYSPTQNKNDLQLYPNPAHNTITISTALYKDDTQMYYTIYDCFGRACMSGKLNSSGKTVFDITELQIGFYIFSTEKNKMSFIKNK